MTAAASHQNRCLPRAAFVACVNARCSSEPSCPSAHRRTAALRCGSASLLSNREVAQATDGEQAVIQALAEDVRLAISTSRCRARPTQAAREITHRKPEVRILTLSLHDN